MKRLALATLAAFALACLTALFMTARGIDFERYAHTIEGVRTLEAWHAELGEAVLQARYGESSDYDRMVRLLTESGTLAGQLQRSHYGDNAAAIDARFDAVAAYVAAEDDDLLRFQSLNSIFQSSSSYLATVARQLDETLPAGALELRDACGDLVRELFALKESGDAEHLRAVGDEIAALRRLHHDFGAKATALVDGLARHAEVIVRYRPLVDEAAARLTDPTAAAMFEALDRHLRTAYLAELRTSARAKTVLYAVSIGLAAAVILLLLRLRGALGRLQAKKRALEANQGELAATNLRLQGSLDELNRAQTELVAASRQSGMAEVATTVLHNVGNVLNSVNMSTELVQGILTRSRLGGMPRAVQLLETNAQVPGFLASDDRGKHLPAYFHALADASAQERSAMSDELARIRKNVEHIKAVVRSQQTHAKSAKVVETLSLDELADDAIAVAIAPARAAQVRVVRDYAALPPVTIDRHRAFQIMLNLLTNASHAVADGGRVTIRTSSPSPGWFALEVEDDGCGIPAENLARIFNHGFSTKKSGHGFGLHDSANAAAELGGTLGVTSAGVGKGARFRLELPLGGAGARTVAS